MVSHAGRRDASSQKRNQPNSRRLGRLARTPAWYTERQHKHLSFTNDSLRSSKHSCLLRIGLSYTKQINNYKENIIRDLPQSASAARQHATSTPGPVCDLDIPGRPPVAPPHGQISNYIHRTSGRRRLNIARAQTGAPRNGQRWRTPHTEIQPFRRVAGRCWQAAVRRSL